MLLVSLQLTKKQGKQMFWVVRTSRIERTGNVIVDSEAKVYSPPKEDGLSTLNAALTSPASSTVEGKVIQVMS